MHADPVTAMAASASDATDSRRTTVSAILLAAGTLGCLIWRVPAAYALFGGAFVALALGNPFSAWSNRLAHAALKAAIVGLGAAVQFGVVLAVGLKSAGMTALTILLVLVAGLWLARRMGLAADLGVLISAGTAICGGSAIGAVAGALNTRAQDTTLALGVIFLLNPLCLLLFPPIGHLLGLSQSEFGLWAALSIHDTSSVVGAAMAYGPEALEVGTLIKLVRALWIVPVALALSFWWVRAGHGQGKGVRVQMPLFIVGFLAVAAAFTYLDFLAPWREWVSEGAKRLFVATLFLIGAGLSRAALREVGLRPVGFGVALWLFVSVATAAAIKAGLIS